MKRVLVMGCGGIGSWLAHFLDFGRRNSTLNAEVSLADPDTVEPKNLLYSNFLPQDVGMNKASALSERYHFTAVQKRIVSVEQLKPFQLVVVATDNGKSREMVYKSGNAWIDLRCKGKAYVVFSSKARKRDSLDTIDSKREGDSCQYERDMEEGRIQSGNLIAASLGYQMVLNWLRGERMNNIVGMA